MIRIFRCVFIIMVVIGPIQLHSQGVADTLQLNEVVVVERINYIKVPGQVSHKLTQLKGKNSPLLSLSDAIEQNTAVSVRSYGLSGISTISVRGAGASHTAVVWNGVNIQSIQNGQFDFSTMPVSLTDDITFIKGGTGAQVGSGSIGGTLFIDNTLEMEKGFKSELTLNAGSFGRYYNNLLIEKKSQTFSSRLVLINIETRNNFTYTNTTRAGSPIDTVKNGQLRRKALLSSTKLRTSKNSTLDMHLWLSRQNAQDPGTMLVPQKGYFTNDDNIRTVMHWELNRDDLTFEARAAYMYGYMKYVGVVESNHFTNAQTNEFSVGQSNTPIQWKTTVVQTTEWLTSADLVAQPRRNRLSIYGIGKYQWRKFETALIARQELVNKTFIPFTMSFGTDFNINKNYTIAAFISRSYRLPSFNDLYWKGWGNPNLRPEDALNKELSLKYTNNYDRSRINANFTLFHNNIRDMIVWAPSGEIWRPDNHSQVLSYGIETDVGYFNYANPKVSYGTNLHYTWVNSISDGYQLIYIPEHKAVASVFADIGKYFINFNHNFTSYRYTNFDNSDLVDGYNLANLSFGRLFDYKQYRFKIYATIGNVYNAKYQIIQYYPTPPRSFEISILLSYKQ